MSRYKLAFTVVNDLDNSSLISPIVPFSYQEFPDTAEYKANKGDMLWDIAEKYWGKKGDSDIGLDNAWSYYSYLGDFQPDPIPDATRSLEAGKVIYVPSIRVIDLYIKNTNRQSDFVTY